MVSSDAAADPDAIRALYERILIAWNGRDASAMAGCFEQDGNLVGFDGSQIDTRSAIEGHLRPIFVDHPTPAYVAKVREVRILRPEVGVLRAAAGMVPPDSGDINPALNTIHTLVAVKSANDWRAAVFQSTPAAWHGRPDDAAALIGELREIVRRGLICA